MNTLPKTLGEKLAQRGAPDNDAALVKLALFQKAWRWAVFAGTVGAFLALVNNFPKMDAAPLLMLLMAIGGVYVLLFDPPPALRKRLTRTGPPGKHFLLAGDRQGFMANLRLDAKTAVMDGSNVYHFGRANGLDAQPLGLIAEQLRREGYRVVCFFDANIFYTLQEHGAFGKTERHDLGLLTDIFGLSTHEIYVVPSGVQADRFVLNTLRHLPISFAVTNDQFRDYAKEYSEVMKSDQWRKGISISKNEIKMHKHKFKKPVYAT